MNAEVAERLDGFVEAGWKVKDYSEYSSWIQKVLAFLDAVAEGEIGESVRRLGGGNSILEWRNYRDRQASHLEGLAMKLRSLARASLVLGSSQIAVEAAGVEQTNKVFVVHGHDVAVKESTARFLEKLSLVPIVLHEQANKGQTIIEKFESHANVGFAVILLTPDDIGASATTPDLRQGRARQNVILELGYFTGKLGRKRVCALYQPGVEIPSDFHGVLFVELDAQGGWKPKLAQELVSAGLQINLQGLLQ